MKIRKNKTKIPLVCYRCKQCKACFLTMDEINLHLLKYNHFTRFSEEGSDSASAIPPLPPVPEEQVTGMASSSSDIDEGERGGGGGRRRSTKNGSRNEVEGETNNNGCGDNIGDSRKSSLDGTTSPLKSYAESVKKRDNTDKPETEKSPTKANLTEKNDVEDMETDTDKPQSPTYDAKSWPAVTSNVDKMETEPSSKSLPESMKVLPNTETMTKSDASAHSPKKTNVASTIPSSGNESVKNGTLQESKTDDTPTLNSVSPETRASSIKVLNKGDSPSNGEGVPPATTPATRSASPQKNKNNGIRLNVRRRTEPSAAESIKEPGNHQPPSSNNVEKVSSGESLSATLTTMKAKLNHMKWRDVPTTAFTYSNQTQTSKSEENVPSPAATGKSNKHRYKCKYCDEWFMYPVQIISHTRREHESISKTADSKFPISTNKRKKADPVKESTTASTTTATKGGQSYPLRSLSTRTRRSTTDVNYNIDKKEKNSKRKPTKFTCRHCSQKFSILAYLKQHLHLRHPEMVLNPEGVQPKKRKLKRFRHSPKRKIQQSLSSSTTVSANSPSNSISVQPTATVSNPMPESEQMEVDEQLTTASVAEANIKSQPKKRTMFSCKHCTKKFPLLNQLKIHLHQEHPEMMGKKKQNKIALNGDQATPVTPVVTSTNEGERGRRRSTQNKNRNEVSESRPKATATRQSQQTKRQSRVSKEKEGPTKRKSTEQISPPPPDKIPEDVKPNLAELKQTMAKAAATATNEVITIEDEPDYEDTAESILAALTSKQSQTCPCCMKFFKFAGSLKNHLKVCTDEYFSSAEGQRGRSQLEDAESGKVDIEDDDEAIEDDDEANDDDEGNNVETESLQEEEEVEEEETEESSKNENNNETTAEEHQVVNQLDDSNTVPYYKQLDYCRCWLCAAVVARFYNLKRHLFQVHKVKMTTNEIHTKQTQLLGIPSPPVKSKM